MKEDILKKAQWQSHQKCCLWKENRNLRKNFGDRDAKGGSLSEKSAHEKDLDLGKETYSGPVVENRKCSKYPYMWRSIGLKYSMSSVNVPESMKACRMRLLQLAYLSNTVRYFSMSIVKSSSVASQVVDCDRSDLDIVAKLVTLKCLGTVLDSAQSTLNKITDNFAAALLIHIHFGRVAVLWVVWINKSAKMWSSTIWPQPWSSDSPSSFLCFA